MAALWTDTPWKSRFGDPGVVDMVTFRDKTFAVAAWLYVAAYAADMNSTRTALQRCSDCFERPVELAAFGSIHVRAAYLNSCRPFACSK
jgi:hypothetical protein